MEEIKESELKTVLVSEETHTRLKVGAATHKTTIGKFIEILLNTKYIPKSQPGEHNK